MILHVMPGDAIEAMCWQTLAPVLLDALAFSSYAPVAAVGVARLGDPEATRTVYATIVVLVVLGVVLAALAVWVLRRTRPEPELLAPLETMETRGWRKLDPAAQRRSLDESRPSGAAPLRREASAPAVDSSFGTVAPVASFDDLSEGGGNSDSDAVVLAVPDATDSAVAAIEELDEASSAAIDATVEAERHTEGDADVADDPDDVAAGEGASESAERKSADDTGEITEDFEFDTEIDDDEVDDVEVDQAHAVGSIDPLLAPKRSSPGLSS